MGSCMRPSREWQLQASPETGTYRNGQFWTLGDIDNNNNNNLQFWAPKRLMVVCRRAVISVWIGHTSSMLVSGEQTATKSIILNLCSVGQHRTETLEIVSSWEHLDSQFSSYIRVNRGHKIGEKSEGSVDNWTGWNWIISPMRVLFYI
jgi:hypothetical protein